ncbi:transposase [Candidatus Poribacteria bacterium]|nr:transposase [Candidatus Poribacteria bacterium]
MAIISDKIALDATDAQCRWFSQQCGYARFAFNHALEDYNNEPCHWQELNKRFNIAKRGIDWSKGMDQRAAVFGIKNLGDAISRWKSGQNRRPKKKRRRNSQSYSTDPNTVKVEWKRIKLPKIGWVRMYQKLRHKGEITKITLSRTAHRWFVSITVDTGKPNVPRDTRGLPAIGIDVGINSLATLDTGKQYPNPRPLKKYEKKLKREHRKLSKKMFLSNNWFKQKRKVERIHYKIACIRADAHHKATTEIVNMASVIGIETLKITNMLKNKNLAKALSDSALGGFLEKLKSKAETLGIPVIQAPQFYASSKTCSNCGHKKKELLLSERTYDCTECGSSIDRDVNAAINLKTLAVGQAESLNACGV